MSVLGRKLVSDGHITEDQLRQSLLEAQSQGVDLSRYLLANEVLTEKQLYRTLAELSSKKFFDFDEEEVDLGAVSLLEPEDLRRLQALPVSREGGRLQVAMVDPLNVDAIDEMSNKTRTRVEPVIAIKSVLFAQIEQHASQSESMDDALGDMDLGDEDENDELEGLTSVSEDAPVVRFVNNVLSKAVTMGASDIHIEPGERELRVRYRVDGVLHEETTANRKTAAAIISRLKIMAEVDIAEKRVPQDGRFSVTAGGKKVDLRFSTLPTVYGEKIVMRILDTSSVLLTLDDLGFLSHNEEMFRDSYTKPYGMILVTGPTGSGKSTTLYATVNVVNQPGVNITTTEDPVEYRLPGINQVPVNAKVGMTFARALRAILRQDPDIVLVGEMRDKETAQIGVEAALTGHLVLSTLHTNNAPSAITRLTEMGIEPFLVGSAVDCVLAQRLARRACSKCKEMVHLEPDVARNAGFDDETAETRPEVPKAVGCKACNDSGYRGRMAVHEIMPVTEEIERLTVERASSEEISRVAQKQGMRTLRQDGLAKVLQGWTTVEEVGRVIV